MRRKPLKIMMPVLAGLLSLAVLAPAVQARDHDDRPRYTTHPVDHDDHRRDRGHHAGRGHGSHRHHGHRHGPPRYRPHRHDHGWGPIYDHRDWRYIPGYLHYRAFRTLQGMFVPLVTALMGVVWALGFMGIIRAPMDPWATRAIPSRCARWSRQSMRRWSSPMLTESDAEPRRA